MWIMNEFEWLKWWIEYYIKTNISNRDEIINKSIYQLIKNGEPIQLFTSARNFNNEYYLLEITLSKIGEKPKEYLKKK